MRKFTRLLALMLVLAMALGMSAQAETAETASIISLFQEPDMDAKGMFRYWLPHAPSDADYIEKQMTDMYEAGFGGVEIAFFPAAVSYDNSEYGWVTENWRETLKSILKIAAGFEDGFVVDFTITPHWPVTINTIDPNDEASDAELITAYAKIAATEGVVDLPMLPFGTTDSAGNAFITTDRLVSAIVGRVTDVDAEGNLTVDPDSLQVVETALSDKTTVAGIPCVDGLAEDSEEYQYVLSLYGGEIPDTSIFFTDSAGDPIDIRTQLADTQNYWTVDLATLGLEDYVPSEGDAIAAGDYVLFGCYARGTAGTILRPPVFEDSLPGVPYYTNPLAEEGTQALIDFLDAYIFCDEELVALMQEASVTVGGAIFEDSNENFYNNGIPWAPEYAETFESVAGYDMTPYLPIISGTVASANGDDAKFHDDYNDTFRALYDENHVLMLQDYIHEKTGFDFRLQPYYTHSDFVEIDLSAASALVDISEGESLAFGINGDSFRLVSGGVHIAGKKFISDEAFAIQEGISYNMTWDRVMDIMNENFAAGVNRLIFHGASYNGVDEGDAVTFTCGWPGWHAFDSICTDAWDDRMSYWEDIDILSNYIARTQAVLQNGTAKMDLLVFDMDSYDRPSRERTGDNSAFRTLLDAGYSYDCVMDDGILLPQLVVEDGVLSADGPAYKAVVVNDLSATSAEVMAQLTAFAEAGLPVIFLGNAPATASNTRSTDADIAAATEALLAMDNVAQVATQEEALARLAELGVKPYAAYAQADLRTLMREDADGSRYYYLYNNSEEDIAVPVTFSGSGTPYILNAWDGSVTPVAGYAASETGVTTTLYMDANDAIIVALTEDTEAFPAPVDNAIVSANVEAVTVDGEAALRVRESGTVTAEYADGATVEQEVTVAEPIDLDIWDLTIESWGPDKSTEAIADTVKVPVEIGETELKVWAELSVSDEQLESAGLASMQDIAGIGTYTIEVELEQLDGAFLVLEHDDDMVTSILVNGEPVSDLAANSERYDLGSSLVEGTNTIEIKLASTLLNRIRPEDGMFATQEPGVYGITSVQIVPYALVK